jgi:CubicO group peptidase (beta-lactamase class C family)
MRQFDDGGGKMRFVAALVKWLLVLVVVAIAGVAAWLYFFPPDLIRVGTGYAAKIVCSNVFIAGRDPDQVLSLDVQAPGNPVLKLITIDVDRNAHTVTAGLLGPFGRSVAVAREGLGCASVPDGDVEQAAALSLPPMPGAPIPDAEWPQGERVAAPQSPAIAAILDDPKATGPGMRAVVVVHDGRVVGERYGDGFSAGTPLLGWSMTKTVNAAIVGTLVKEGRLTLDDTALFETWDADNRGAISLASLMSMSSGLAFNEDYGDVTDVTRMLYLEPDMAAFAADKPLTGQAGPAFSYSSGTGVMISRVWQDALDDPEAALAWPREHLFMPVGMRSAVLETDESGTFVGSSYLYATARDWARFGQLLLQDGEWNGEQILPEGYVAWMHEPSQAAPEVYGKGQLWMHGPGIGTEDGPPADAGFAIPADAYWMIGHDGQTVAIIPSKKLVVVRMGLTPSKLGYKPQALVAALAAAVQ